MMCVVNYHFGSFQSDCFPLSMVRMDCEFALNESPSQHKQEFGVVMVIPDNKSFYPPDSLTSTEGEQRLTAIAELGLLEAESIPVFEEATQTAAHFLDIPICTLGLIDRDRECLKSAVGLSRLGLMNEIAATRQIASAMSLSYHVVSTRQVLAINDTLADPQFADNPLVQRYRLRAYLGVPILDSKGRCLGALAVMDLVPRTFTAKEIGFLELTARWSMSEFERNWLLKQPVLPCHQASTASPGLSSQAITELPLGNPIRVQLLAQLTQELRTPLTSVMGMTSVLNREIYGPLTSKQKEYLDIVYQSGQYLLSLVNEIVELGNLDDSTTTLNLVSVDVEMLCQQAINTLEQAANRREQKIRLTIEPGHRIWLLDKIKVKQMIYHLVFSVIQSSVAGSEVRLHISRKQDRLHIAVWVSNPWLGESLPYGEVYAYQHVAIDPVDATDHLAAYHPANAEDLTLNPPGALVIEPQAASRNLTNLQIHPSRENLGLQLSRLLAEMHNGQISIQGSPESGYRYVISLPQMPPMDFT